MAPFSNILVPTDFSAGATLAVERALQLRQALGGKLTLLHVYELPVFYMQVYAYSAELIGQIDLAARKAMTGALDAATARARQLAGDRQMPALEAKVVAGSPSQAIVEEARQGGHDLIVMGTQGRSAFARLLIGSVAERVVRAAPCAVMVVRAPAQQR